MPQLNPAPWFAILVFSWLVFLIIIPTKVMNHTSPNEPALLDSEKHKTEPWDWPWQ
uniref:ATP synthase complex subunit 8 n=1 Tax=Yunnanilus pleurotaenia TaxID=1758147 RepID=A0A9Y1M015_9TELE|nr:ATP synthase F0 subunit 8 [Yunnanilus jiuchiensis]YP_010355027.1 ATP synthase F0 subunit 8 [Eonemachilus longidorsalis]YP_010372514.1 ATP synthase F0 subunit 8 [Yunnanilus pleurotaenia]YP_010414138.1 ATP synthase F0 subunit 8 [Yunnanilus analis]WRO45338.1 ATP synthase F0 subunit 8 [Yunnanilus nanpanjiangensis]QVG61429.1 ATP synthase F0 subunit 8 [Yunnanilus jiuchiensis]UOG84875.1 ATP synthase F0 subunit 8 [Eonemachilus longidorsalis]UPE50003.1 ATP synthase F0 subunit 8 [Yunnanilus pleurot